MNKLVLLLVIFTSSVHAQMSRYKSPDNVDWDKEYEILSEYDVQTGRYNWNEDWYKRLKDGDDNWKEPSKEVTEALKLLRPIIHRYANVYDVDPRAIVASVLAENSLNVSVDDRAQQYLVKLTSDLGSNALAKSWSFGFGQLNHEVARVAEDEIVSKKEGRDPISDDELTKKILSPEQTMKYIAAILSKYQKVYKDCGADISDNPAILATLYNLGGVEKRCENMKKTKKEPRVNFFGFFTWKYLNEIEDIVGDPSDINSIFVNSNGKYLHEVVEAKKINPDATQELFKERESEILYKANPVDALRVDNRHIQVQMEMVEREMAKRKLEQELKDKKDGKEKVLYVSGNNFVGHSYPVGCVDSSATKSTPKAIKKNTEIIKVSEKANCGKKSWMLVTLNDGQQMWVEEKILFTETEILSTAKKYACKRTAKNCFPASVYKNINIDPVLGIATLPIKADEDGEESPSCKFYDRTDKEQEIKSLIDKCKSFDQGEYTILNPIKEIHKNLKAEYIETDFIARELSILYAICEKSPIIKENESQFRFRRNENLEAETCDYVQENSNQTIVTTGRHVNDVLFKVISGAGNFTSQVAEALNSLNQKIKTYSKNKKKCFKSKKANLEQIAKKYSRYSCVKNIRAPFMHSVEQLIQQDQKKLFYDPSVQNIVLDLGNLDCKEQ